MGYGGCAAANLPVKVPCPPLELFVLLFAMPPRLVEVVVLPNEATERPRDDQLGRDNAAQVAGIGDRTERDQQVVVCVQDAGEAGGHAVS